VNRVRSEILEGDPGSAQDRAGPNRYSGSHVGVSCDPGVLTNLDRRLDDHSRWVFAIEGRRTEPDVLRNRCKATQNDLGVTLYFRIRPNICEGLHHEILGTPNSGRTVDIRPRGDAGAETAQKPTPPSS
jgi:hypothetical protein